MGVEGPRGQRVERQWRGGMRERERQRENDGEQDREK